MPYPVGSVLGRITASGKHKLATSGGSDGAETATAVLLYAVDATLADAIGIVLVRGPAIVSRPRSPTTARSMTGPRSPSRSAARRSGHHCAQYRLIHVTHSSPRGPYRPIPATSPHPPDQSS